MSDRPLELECTKKSKTSFTKMLGTFQQSQIRIEIEASADKISESLLRPVQLQKWLPAGRFPLGMPEQLYPGFEFTRWNGPIPVHHHVDVATPNSLRLILSQGIDGYHEWYWGEGWVQSRLEGITMLPLALGQTLSLLSLRQFLAMQRDSKGS